MQDFSLSVTPSSATALPGGVAAYTVTAASLNGFTGQINFAQSTTLPSGVSAVWNPASQSCTVPVGGSCSATYTVTVGTAAAGDTGLSFHGTYAPALLTRSASATLHVSPPAPQTTPLTHEYAISKPNNGNPNSGSVTHLKISGNLVIAPPVTIPLNCSPSSIDHSQDGNYEYIGCTSPANGDGIVVIRTADDTPVAKIGVVGPTFVLVRPNDAQLYVGSANGQVLTVNIAKQPDGSRKNVVVASRTITLPLGDSVTSLAFVPGGGILAIGANTGNTHLWDVVGNLPIHLASHQSLNGVQAVGLSQDATKTYAFLTSPVYARDANGNVLPAGNVHIMDTATLTVQETRMCSPNLITAALLVRKQYFYVTQVNGTLCTIDTATDTVVNSPALGGFLVAEDVMGKRLFVANGQDNDVETVKLGTTPAMDKQGVSFGNLPAGSTVVGVSVFNK